MIVLDASVVISHLAGDVHSSKALDIIDTEEELALHPLTLAECLVGPALVGREAEALRIIETLGIATVPVTDQQPSRWRGCVPKPRCACPVVACWRPRSRPVQAWPPSM